MSSIKSSKHRAKRKALKALWRRCVQGAPRIPPTEFLRNERGFRFAKGVKLARGSRP